MNAIRFLFIALCFTVAGQSTASSIRVCDSIAHGTQNHYLMIQRGNGPKRYLPARWRGDVGYYEELRAQLALPIADGSSTFREQQMDLGMGRVTRRRQGDQRSASFFTNNLLSHRGTLTYEYPSTENVADYTLVDQYCGVLEAIR